MANGNPASYSTRMARPLIGMGLLEAIPEADILAHADPTDCNKDGISGVPNMPPCGTTVNGVVSGGGHARPAPAAAGGATGVVPVVAAGLPAGASAGRRAEPPQAANAAIPKTMVSALTSSRG